MHTSVRSIFSSAVLGTAVHVTQSFAIVIDTQALITFATLENMLENTKEIFRVNNSCPDC